MNRKHAQPVIQVFTELPLLHELFQIPACSGNQPDIRLDLLIAADPRKRTLLNKTQQFELYPLAQAADLVKKQRPPVCGFRTAAL